MRRSYAIARNESVPRPHVSLKVPKFLTRLVDVLEDLEREHCRADFTRLAVPDELHLPLVLKQQEAVLFGQCLAFVDELDEVSLLGVRELVPHSVWTVHAHDWYSVKATASAAIVAGGCCSKPFWSTKANL